MEGAEDLRRVRVPQVPGSPGEGRRGALSAHGAERAGQARQQGTELKGNDRSRANKTDSGLRGHSPEKCAHWKVKTRGLVRDLHLMPS